MLDTPVIENDSVMLDQLQNAVDALAAAGCVVEKPRHKLINTNTSRTTSCCFVLQRALANDEVFAAALEGSTAWDGGDRGYQALVDHAMTMSHREWFQHHNRREGYRNTWAEFFGEYDLLFVQLRPRLHTHTTTQERGRPAAFRSTAEVNSSSTSCSGPVGR